MMEVSSLTDPAPRHPWDRHL